MGGFGIDRYITHELIMYFSPKRKASFSGNLRVQGEQGISHRLFQVSFREVLESDAMWQFIEQIS